MTTTEHPIFTHNDLPAEVRDTVTTLLNQQLADTFDLYTQVKQAHWNVKGMQFLQLHLFFDELAESLLEFTDLIAERATALGGKALGTARIVAAQSRLPEFPVDIVTAKQVVEVLAQRYGAYCSANRDALSSADQYGDPITADLCEQIARTVEKQLWMIEAHIQE